MADYKVIFRADETSGSSTLLWEPGCPCLIEAVQISRNTETAQTYLQIKVCNITDSQINSVYGTATVYYENSSSEEVGFKDLDADILPGQTKAIKAISLPSGDIISAVAKLTRIKQPDRVWKACRDPRAIPRAIQLELDYRANAERQRLLSENNVDALSHVYSVQDNGDWWICSCGQLNVSHTTCCNCGISKDLIKLFNDESTLLTSGDKWADGIYNQAAYFENSFDDTNSLQKAISLYNSVKAWKDSAIRIEGCKNRIARLEYRTAEQKKQNERKKRFRILALVISVIVIITSVWVITNVIIPVYHAKELYHQGQYFEALEIFDTL